MLLRSPVVCQLHYVQRNPEDSGDERQSERDIGLTLRGALSRPLEREVWGDRGVGRLRHHAEAGRTPDAAIVAFAVEPREHLGGAGYLPDDPQPGEQLEPIDR